MEGPAAHDPPTTGPQDSQLTCLLTPPKFKIRSNLERDLTVTVTRHLSQYHPKEIGCTTHHDVGGYDLRIHTDRFNEEGLQQGQRTRGGGAEPETWSVTCVSFQGLSLPPTSLLTRPEHPLAKGCVTVS